MRGRPTSEAVFRKHIAPYHACTLCGALIRWALRDCFACNKIVLVAAKYAGASEPFTSFRPYQAIQPAKAYIACDDCRAVAFPPGGKCEAHEETK